jgi:hypothetical protein
LYLSAFASLRHPPSRRYYDRKRAEGKSHTAALTCLARRRVDVLHAMLRDRQPYRPAHLDPTAPRTANRLLPLDETDRDTFVVNRWSEGSFSGCSS